MGHPKAFFGMKARPPADGFDGGSLLLLQIAHASLYKRVWLTLTRGDQLAQIAVYERATCIPTATIAFILGYQTYACKTDFRFALFFRDIKNNVRVIPLAFFFHKSEMAF